MPLTLEEKIAKTEAALQDEDNPAKLVTLHNRLSLLQAAKKEMDDDEEDDEDDEDEKKSRSKSRHTEDEKKSKKADEEEKKASRASKKYEDEEKKSRHSEEDEKKAAAKRAEDEEEEEEESKKASAALALIESATGQRGSAAIGATAAMFARLASVEQVTRELAAKSRADERSQLIASVKNYVPKGQIEWLQGQKLSVVKGFVEQALKGSPMVHTEEGHLLVPNAAKPNTLEALPKEVQEMVRGAVSALPSSMSTDARNAFEADLVRKHHENQSKLNGEGRY